MAHLRIAGMQINPIVGDIEANATKIISSCMNAAENDAHLVLFGELTLVGYPVEDLALRSSFIERSISAIHLLAEQLAHHGLGNIPVVVGYLDSDQYSDQYSDQCSDQYHENDDKHYNSQPLHGIRNAAAVLYDGKVVGKYWKHWLPNYGVFDEQRWFLPGYNLLTITINNHRLGIAICEDIWHSQGPVHEYALLGIDGLLCLNASPFHRYQPLIRSDIIRSRIHQLNAPIYYVNIVGGQDELVFDGNSQFVGDIDGDITTLAAAKNFVEDALFYDIDIANTTAPNIITSPTAPWQVTNIDISLNLSQSDHLPNTSSATSRLVHNTQKIQNTFNTTSTLASPALSLSSVSPVDSIYSPTASLLTTNSMLSNDSDYSRIWNALVLGTKDYVHKIGAKTVLLGLSGGIDSAVVAVIACDAFGADNVYAVAMPSKYSSEGSISDAQALAQAVSLHFRCEPIERMVETYISQLQLTGLAEENIQARCRGMLLMAISNQENHLVLATGNKSELSVGYSTIYGDAVGAYAPIRDVPKTLVYGLAHWRNSLPDSPIPINSIIKAPSAELRPDQKDSDSLPDYEVLDAILVRYVDYDADPIDISTELEIDLSEVLRICRLVDRAEFKRRQYPLGPKITVKAFGRDRRVPLINRWLNHLNTNHEPS